MLIASNLLPKKFINNRVIGSCHYIEKVMKEARLPIRPFNDTKRTRCWPMRICKDIPEKKNNLTPNFDHTMEEGEYHTQTKMHKPFRQPPFSLFLEKTALSHFLPRPVEVIRVNNQISLTVTFFKTY